MIVAERQRPYSEGLVTLTLRREASMELLCTASTDLGFATGTFHFYDEYEEAIGVLTRDPSWGWEYTLRSSSSPCRNIAMVKYKSSGFADLFSADVQDFMTASPPMGFDVAIGAHALEVANRGGPMAVTRGGGLSSLIATCIPVLSSNNNPWYDDYGGGSSSSYGEGVTTSSSSSTAGHSYAALGAAGASPDSVEECVTDAEHLTTRPPVWNSEAGAYLSNFGSRIKIHEKSNFILIPSHSAFGCRAEAATVMLRFGKVLRNRWVLDFRLPTSKQHHGGQLTPLVAFAIACASLARKPFVGDF